MKILLYFVPGNVTVVTLKTEDSKCNQSVMEWSKKEKGFLKYLYHMRKKKKFHPTLGRNLFLPCMMGVRQYGL